MSAQVPPAASPSPADRLKAALAKKLFDCSDAHAARVEQFVADHEPAMINAMINFLEKHYDRTTMQARMAEGPLLQTLRNMVPDLTTDTTGALDEGFGLLETYLLGVAKAGGAA